MSTRDADLQELRNAFNNSRSPKERADIQHAASVISNESKKISDMRESLIRARRRGDIGEVKDINHFVQTHREYQNER